LFIPALLVGALGAPTLIQGQEAPMPGKVVLENEKVRVREVVLEPGKETGMHSHDLDYLTVILQGGTAKFTLADGKAETRQINSGEVQWGGKGSHSVTNTGTAPNKAFIIELK
jgi:quercetin dioxygenase-like cupin family protein